MVERNSGKESFDDASTPLVCRVVRARLDCTVKAVCNLGPVHGIDVGTGVGTGVGICVGTLVGTGVGTGVGALVGNDVGTGVGTGVGIYVGTLS